MNNYSPISKLRVKNFRNIGDVTIDFEQSPIVALVGENEAGKTSIIKAFSMCALHDSPRDQKDYIRDGTQALGIEIDLADSTKIVRIKQTNGGNIYRVISPDGSTWDTTKITDGLPEKINQLMGLIVEPETGEYLNVRTYEDRLLFVVTPASTNYKVMYNALKVEQLTKAIKLGSTEVNSIRSQINQNESSIQTLNTQLRQITVYDTEPLISIRDRIKSQLSQLDKISKLQSLISQLEASETKLGALALIDMYNLQPISELLASRLNTASRLLNSRVDLVSKRELYNELNNIDFIDTSTLIKLSKLKEKVDKLNEKIESTRTLSEVANLESISESLTMKISRSIGLIERLRALNNAARAIDTSECVEINAVEVSSINKFIKISDDISKVAEKTALWGQYTNYVAQIDEYLKQCGVAVESCPKCGESVIFDLDKLQ